MKKVLFVLLCKREHTDPKEANLNISINTECCFLVLLDFTGKSCSLVRIYTKEAV